MNLIGMSIQLMNLNENYFFLLIFEIRLRYLLKVGNDMNRYPVALLHL